MQFRLLGWPEDSPRLDLDHERFAYAGNYVTGRTGIAAALAADADPTAAPIESQRDDEPWSPSEDAVLAVASFDEDRAADGALRIRYVSVRTDHRDGGIGPRLLAFVVDRALERGYDRVRIGVNNPIAYQAGYRAGFAFTGEESGMGELVLEAPAPDPSTEQYRDGFDRFADRDLPVEQQSVVERHRDGQPPDVIDPETPER
ncbi:GCN5-like N-acetyltransferase [Salinarchaeum sp. Harcht-Bsk1]|uniref:GNAT family N-acetyltransferase n=1 Tax=Salinarchaeum sp. Harcht-Bsk1 TaxID=1333523 RepID=UPI0003422B30|nr:GNAT family N-acetyltransferase [Salinarchaeum sp. Harcht-Bsk1]AGM99998.1 GCN5-like N-acetyltransferase [Salinarchaeum sp. Harcht-Bsk1]